MTTTSSPASRAATTPLTFAAQPGGGFPAVLSEDHAEVAAPAGGEPMHVVHRYRGSAERKKLSGVADGQPLRNSADRRRSSG